MTTDPTIPGIQRGMYSNKWDWQGPDLGGVAWQDNIPADAYYLPPVPSGNGDSTNLRWPGTGNLRWWWSHADQAWIEVPDPDATPPDEPENSEE